MMAEELKEKKVKMQEEEEKSPPGGWRTCSMADVLMVLKGWRPTDRTVDLAFVLVLAVAETITFCASRYWEMAFNMSMMLIAVAAVYLFVRVSTRRSVFRLTTDEESRTRTPCAFLFASGAVLMMSAAAMGFGEDALAGPHWTNSDNTLSDAYAVIVPAAFATGLVNVAVSWNPWNPSRLAAAFAVAVNLNFFFGNAAFTEFWTRGFFLDSRMDYETGLPRALGEDMQEWVQKASTDRLPGAYPYPFLKAHLARTVPYPLAVIVSLASGLLLVPSILEFSFTKPTTGSPKTTRSLVIAMLGTLLLPLSLFKTYAATSLSVSPLFGYRGGDFSGFASISLMVSTAAAFAALSCAVRSSPSGRWRAVLVAWLACSAICADFNFVHRFRNFERAAEDKYESLTACSSPGRPVEGWEVGAADLVADQFCFLSSSSGGVECLDKFRLCDGVIDLPFRVQFVPKEQCFDFRALDDAVIADDEEDFNRTDIVPLPIVDPPPPMHPEFPDDVDHVFDHEPYRDYHPHYPQVDPGYDHYYPPMDGGGRRPPRYDYGSEWDSAALADEAFCRKHFGPQLDMWRTANWWSMLICSAVVLASVVLLQPREQALGASPSPFRPFKYWQKVREIQARNVAVISSQRMDDDEGGITGRGKINSPC